MGLLLIVLLGVWVLWFDCVNLVCFRDLLFCFVVCSFVDVLWLVCLDFWFLIVVCICFCFGSLVLGYLFLGIWALVSFDCVRLLVMGFYGWFLLFARFGVIFFCDWCYLWVIYFCGFDCIVVYYVIVLLFCSFCLFDCVSVCFAFVDCLFCVFGLVWVFNYVWVCYCCVFFVCGFVCIDFCGLCLWWFVLFVCVWLCFRDDVVLWFVCLVVVLFVMVFQFSWVCAVS